MDWSVSEDGRAGIGATRACLPRLHSHFMAEWKPGRIDPKIGNRLSEWHDTWGRTCLSILARASDTRRSRDAAVPRASYWSFPKQSLPHYCAVQHENARFKAKFYVTFSFALG